MKFDDAFHRRWVPLAHLASHFWKSGRLHLRLLNDPRVPAYLKLFFFLTVLYILSPVDFVPEIVFPLVGVADDVGFFLLMLKIFLRLCPRDVVVEHVRVITQPRNG